ncbi:MAG: hypothetical protein VX288_03370 [Planctomycetota bacterium]|nr:hypothetical protein [Planctomycetota bacterium]
MVAVDDESLRASASESRGDNRAFVVDLVAIGVLESPNRVTIANQKPALSIKNQVVGSACERSVGGLVDVETLRKIELAVEQSGRVGSQGLQAGQEDKDAEREL